MGVEIPNQVQLGYGIRLIHPFNITINSKAIIGDNVTLLKGATIGNEKRGKRIGSPVIGNTVYIGMNATIVGNVTIGDDVLIAANSFVNFSVPSHSIVYGNPGVIKTLPPDQIATEEYVNNVAEIPD